MSRVVSLSARCNSLGCVGGAAPNQWPDVFPSLLNLFSHCPCFLLPHRHQHVASNLMPDVVERSHRPQYASSLPRVSACPSYPQSLHDDQTTITSESTTVKSKNFKLNRLIAIFYILALHSSSGMLADPQKTQIPLELESIFSAIHSEAYIEYISVFTDVPLHTIVNVWHQHVHLTSPSSGMT